MKKLISMFLVCGVLAGGLFSATVQAEESSQEPIRIEFERQLSLVDGSSPQKSSDASKGYALGIYSSTEPKLLIPVTISESGYYDISYVAGYYNGSSYVSRIDFNLYIKSSFPLPCNNQDTPSTELSFDTTWSHQKIHLFERPTIWIDANEYYLEVKLGKTPDNQYKGFLDYFEFKPSEKAKIEAGAVTKIEFDEYAHQGVYDWDRGVTKNANASGGALVFRSSLARKELGNPGTVLSIPVSVEKSGYYHINYVSGMINSDNERWLDKVEFKLGDVLIGDNYEEDAESVLDWGVWDSQQTGLYKKTWVWLPAGDHDLTVNVYRNPVNDYLIYHCDYMEFIPATNGITLDDGTIKVHAKYFENKSGRVIMAAYNGASLVGSLSYDVQNAEYANFEYTPDKEVTKVKVFLWNASNELRPIELEREFILSE